MSNLAVGFELMWQGMLGIFIVMISIALIVVLLTRVTQENKDK